MKNTMEKMVRGVLDKVLAGDESALPRLARNLGHALHRNNLEELNEFRSTVACYLESPPSIFFETYLKALLEVAAAYSIRLEEDARDKINLETIRESKTALLLMDLLFRKQKTLEEIYKELALAGVTPEEINGPLSGLVEGWVVEHWIEKGPFMLSMYGEKLARMLKSETK